MTARIRILIVDDQTLVREGFRTLLELEPDFEVLGTAGDGEAAVAAVERLALTGPPPDVILMDVRMPRLDGIGATRALKARWPALQIVILTTFDDTELIQEGLHAGASGYSLKDITAEQLALTVRTAASGQVLLQPDIARKAFAAFAAPAPPPPAAPPLAGFAEPLTEREREILTFVCRGASNREIGEALYLTEGTVKNHMTNILNKMGVRDRTQAALRAREWGLA